MNEPMLNYPSPRGDFAFIEFKGGYNFRSGTVVYRGSIIGDGFEGGHNLIIREECRIGNRVRIWSNTVIDFGCIIDDEVKIHCNCYLSQGTKIGAGTFIAPGVLTLNSKTMEMEYDKSMKGPTIGRRCRIGAGAIIFPGVKIGDGAWVGAGALVMDDVKPGSIVVSRQLPAEPLPGSEEKRTKDWKALQK